MFANLLLAAAFQVGPFYEQRTDFDAVRPFYAREGEVTDVAWPVFASHRDWWRFCYVVHYQSYTDTAYQFDIVPVWFNGRSREGEGYAGLFPVFGHHPHVLNVYDADFVLWPVWMRYRMPRPSENKWMTTHAVLFPFVHWRDDGSWGFWPFCGVNHRRESDHRYALWPFVTWASYRDDRDTAGEGHSWMVWPFYGNVRRAREGAQYYLPPFFSISSTWNRARPGEDIRFKPSGIRVRAPWPLVEYESSASRERLSLWPFYEHVDELGYADGQKDSSVTRFGWKLVELYDDETRVFPFWTSRKDDSYFRLWPFYESWTVGKSDGSKVEGSVESVPEVATVETKTSRCLALFPIRWVPAVDRSWSKFWTFYERTESPVRSDHSLLWGIVRWSDWK